MLVVSTQDGYLSADETNQGDDRMKEHSNGWCCTDCLILLANGETNPEWSDIGTQDYLNSVEQNTQGLEVTLGRMFGEEGCEHAHEDWDANPEPHSEKCERLTFSMSSCDVCGSNLGGAREAVTFWFDSRVPA